MKTHFFIKTILLSIMLSFSVSAWADGDSNDSIPPITKDPIGSKIEIPLKGIRWDRSPIEPMVAYYYIGEYTIDMEFCSNVGAANIRVVNTNGTTIYNFTHDTAVEGGCTIFLPIGSDCYYIYISGNRYEASGQLCI